MRQSSGGGVFVCARVHIPQSTQKTHCWLDPKQHSRLFPTDKEALVSPSETGPIHCLWLQKTGNRSHSQGAQFTEQTAETLLEKARGKIPRTGHEQQTGIIYTKYNKLRLYTE